MTLQQRASDKHAPPGEHAPEQLNSPPSRRCELECSRAFCVLAPDERGRWWPDEACAAIRALIKKESA